MKVMQRGRLLGALAVPLFMAQCAPQCAPPPPPPASISEAWGRFDGDLSARLLGGGATSASVTVSLGGEVVHSTAYGKRLGWTDEPAEPGDRFRIASISKVVTAIVVLQLVESGQLGLDQAVGGAIAQGLGVAPIDARFNEITVRQLLSHTSGLGTFESLVFGGMVGSCPEAARRAVGVNLGGAPGSKYTYSNLGYCLLGQLVEQVTGRSYESVARDQLLSPLGIGGMRLAGTNDVQASEVFHWQQPNRNYMDVLGPGRIVDGHVGRRRADRRLARSRQARLPPARCRHGGADAGSFAVPVLAGPLVRARAHLLHRRDLGSHGDAGERPRHGAAPQRRHDVVDPRQR